MALSSPTKLTSSASFSPSIRISLRLKIHQAQAKNFCRVLDIRVAQGVEGKVPDVGIFQQAVIVILESFLLKVVSKLVGDDEAIVGVLIPCPNLILRLLLFQAGKLVCIVRVSGIVRREFLVLGVPNTISVLFSPSWASYLARRLMVRRT